MKTILTIILASLVQSLIFAQSIEKFSIDSGGASTSANGIEILFTIGEVSIQELSTASVSISEGFINADFKILVNPQVFLQGPMLNPSSPGIMNDDLRLAGYLPTISPYADAATCDASVFTVTGNDAIVDWVWVELRAANDSSRLINAHSAFVQRDGDIVGLNGTSNLTMRAAPTNYYVVIKHRNHLGAMSSVPIALSDTSNTIIDFRDNGFLTFGNNAQVQLASNNMALWSGDTNNNKSIVFSGSNNDVNAIKDYILADPLNFLSFITFSSIGYLNEDLDLNGTARFSGSPNDSNIIKDNILSHPANFLNLPTFTIGTTIPTQN